MTIASLGIVKPSTPSPSRPSTPPPPPHNTPENSPKSEIPVSDTSTKAVSEPFCLVEAFIHGINDMKRAQFEMPIEWVKAVKEYLEHRKHIRH